MELDVLSAYLSIPPIFRFTKTGNKIVREATNLTYSGLSNYIAILIKKGFLKQDIAGNITTLPILEVADDGQTYLIKLTNYENEV
jgi:hypothetical protein